MTATPTAPLTAAELDAIAHIVDTEAWGTPGHCLRARDMHRLLSLAREALALQPLREAAAQVVVDRSPIPGWGHTIDEAVETVYLDALEAALLAAGRATAGTK